MDGSGRKETPNIIHSWRILATNVGIRITGGANGNVIGPKEPNLSNSITLLDGQSIAGIHIDGNVIPMAEREANRNRFYNNQISSFTMLEADVDLFTEPARGVGLLISNGSSGNIFGELTTTNYLTGVLIENASGNAVRSASISAYGNRQAHYASVIVRNCTDNLIGGLRPGEGNRIGSPQFGALDAAGPKSAGVALVGGGNHTVRGNIIGVQAGHGILIDDSSSNLIGGARADGNQLIENARSGLAITGASSQNNVVMGNWIGTDSTGAVLGNKEHGVLIEGAAAANRIGGRLPAQAGAPSFMRVGVQPLGYSGNVMANSGEEGIFVSGPSTIGNPLSYNSVYGNGGRGIALSAGGNAGLQVAATGSVGVGRATGTITNLDEVPPGSIIQLFADANGQGELYLGETEVLQGGSWLVDSLPPFPFTDLTFTATTPDASGFGNTSEFYPLGFAVEPSFEVTRLKGDEPKDRVAAFAEGRLPVLALRASAAAVPVELGSLKIKARGSLDEVNQLESVRLYRDNNRDGLLSDGDEDVAEAQSFMTPDGEVTFTLQGSIVSPGVPLDLLVVYQSSSTIPQGTTLGAELVAANSIGARYLYPPGEAVPSNAFPVASDNLTIGEAPAGLTFASWQSQFFPGEGNAGVVGPNADPDSDGVANLLEFAFGTDPTKRDSAHYPKPMSGGVRGLVYSRSPDAETATISVEASPDMLLWSEARGTSSENGSEVRFTSSDTNEEIFLRLRVVLLE